MQVDRPVDETDPSIDPSTYIFKAKASAKRDFSDEFPAVRDQALGSASLEQAAELLLGLEKRSRLAGDSKTCLDAALFLLSLCAEQKKWAKLCEYTTLLFKRRSQFKTVQERIVQHVFTFVPSSPSLDDEVALIACLRHVAEGKLFLEVERARLTKRYAEILEVNLNDVSKACEVLQEEQVENYGGLDKREKLEFLLDQIRLVWVKRDFVRMAILARKVNRKWLETKDVFDLKARLHGFLLHLHAHEGDLFQMAEDYLAQASCHVESDPAQWNRDMQLAGVCLALSPNDSHQVSLMHVVLGSELRDADFVRELLTRLVTEEIAALPTELPEELFAPLPAGSALTLRDRVIEHNIRVVSRYYTRIRLARFASLLSLEENELEVHVSRMVTSVTASCKLFAKIDRLAGIVYFGDRKDANTLLTERLGGDLSTLLDLVETAVHEIHKENMIYGLQ